MPNYTKETLQTHQGEVKLTGSNRSVVPPIYQSAKFTTDTLAELRELWTQKKGRFVYSRVSNPTVRHLEELLADQQGMEEALCVSSGMAAISNLMLGYLSSGDHVIMFYESYKPMRYLVRKMLVRFGIDYSIISHQDEGALENAFRPGETKMLLFESPTNPMTRVADIEKITTLCQKHGVKTILDNTFSGFQNHQGYSIDFMVHSLTKFASGHSDAMGGVILGNASDIAQIRKEALVLGAVMDPNTAFLIARGMKTYSLRYERQCENALKIADFLAEHPKVENVMYPGRADHPDHLLAKKQQKDFGTMICFDMKGGASRLETFVDKLQLYVKTASLGSTESLVAPALMFFASDLTEEERDIVGISDRTVRLAIGIENSSDLIEDLRQALDKL